MDITNDLTCFNYCAFYRQLFCRLGVRSNGVKKYDSQSIFLFMIICGINHFFYFCLLNRKSSLNQHKLTKIRRL